MFRGLRTISPAVARVGNPPSGADSRIRALGKLWVARATGVLQLSTGDREEAGAGLAAVMPRIVPIYRGGLCNPEDGPALIESLLLGTVEFEPVGVRGAGDVLTMGASVLAAAREVVSAPSPAAVWELAPSVERVRLDGLGVSAGALGLLDGLAPDLVQLVVGETGWREVLRDLSALEMIGAVRAVYGMWEEGVPFEDTDEAEPTDPRLPGALMVEDDSDEAVIAEARAEIEAGRVDAAVARLRAERDQRIDSALIVAWLAFAEALRGNAGCQHDFRPRHWARFARAMDPVDPEVRLLSTRVETLCEVHCLTQHQPPVPAAVRLCRSF